MLHLPSALTLCMSCLQAIQDARRLVQHHTAEVEAQLHALTQVLLPSVDALRSQTAKDALSLFQVGSAPLDTLPPPDAIILAHWQIFQVMCGQLMQCTKAVVAHS